MPQKRELILEYLLVRLLMLNTRDEIDVNIYVIASDSEHKILLSDCNKSHSFLKILAEQHSLTIFKILDLRSLPKFQCASSTHSENVVLIW